MATRDIDLNVRLSENAQRKLNGIQKELGETAAVAQATDSSMDNIGDGMGERVSDELKEVRQQVHRAQSDFEGLDTTIGDMFSERERAQMFGGEGGRGVRQADFQVPDIGDSIRQLDQLEQGVDKVASQQGVLGSVTQETERRIDQEADAFARAAEDSLSLAEMKEIAEGNNKALARAAGVTQASINEEAESMVNARLSAGALAEKLDDVNEELYEQAIAMGQSSSAAMAWATSMRGMEEAAEDAEDEVSDLNREITEFSFETLAASINIGPFNFQLRQMAIQIPALLTLFGGLTTSIAGVTAAAITAGVAFGGIFGAGLLTMGEQAAEANSELEGTMEGIQHVMEGFRDQLVNALEPLQNQQSIQMLERFVDGVARLVNISARGIAGMQDFLSVFQADIGRSFFHNMPNLVVEIQETIRAFAPFINDFIYWFMDALPRALAFFEEQGVRILPTIAAFGKQLIETTKEFSRFGVTLFKAVLPVLGVFLQTLTDVVKVVNSIPDGLLVNALKLGAFILLLKKTVNAGQNLGKAIMDLDFLVTDLADDFENLSDSIEESDGSMESLNESLAEFKKARGEGVSGEAESNFLISLAQGLLLLFRWKDTIAILRSAFSAIARTLATGVFGLISAKLAIVLSVLLVVVGAIWAFQDALSVGIERFSEILNLGSGFSDMMGGINELIDQSAGLLGGWIDAWTAIYQTIFNILSIGIIRFFEILAGVIDFLINDLGPMNEIVAAIGQGFNDLTDRTDDFMESMREVGPAVTEGLSIAATALEDFINNTFIKGINRMIDSYNKLLDMPGTKEAISAATGVPVDGIDEVGRLQEVDFRSRDFEVGGRQPTKQPTPEVSVYNETNNNVEEINARPEDKQRIKGLVRDAMEEANTFRRRKEAFSG